VNWPRTVRADSVSTTDFAIRAYASIAIHPSYHQRGRALGPACVEVLWRRDIIFTDNHGEPGHSDRTGIRSRPGDSDTGIAIEPESHRGLTAVEAGSLRPLIKWPPEDAH